MKLFAASQTISSGAGRRTESVGPAGSATAAMPSRSVDGICGKLYSMPIVNISQVAGPVAKFFGTGPRNSSECG